MEYVCSPGNHILSFFSKALALEVYIQKNKLKGLGWCSEHFLSKHSGGLLVV